MQEPVSKAPFFDRDCILGKGTYATVFAGELGLAVKRIELHKINKKFEGREEVAMKKMDHPNVLTLLDAVQDRDFKYLIFERCLGTVRDYITGDPKYDGHMPSEVEALRQMASGLAYIHSQDVVHRDIKPENVLISSAFILKISDFGCCKSTAPDGSMSVTSGPQGTRIYFAPEYLRLEGSNTTVEDRKNIRADKSIDIFSLGCLFFTYIVKKGAFIHLFATPGRTYRNRETYDHDVTRNILKNNKFTEENGIPSEHYAFEMINGMTQAQSKDRWVLDEGQSQTNSVLGTLKKELEREQKK
ncbi:hypothetical protein GHT06_012031 [Daphnia sinensis]|uniref:Protein kinase domain-containing protein n=1 Tax=Daphnia sinensis TaxID=1820382 RepID=A0AAD5PZH4_9CRUS|nr:hypothetical protein GHT06_012031 [Daphnia sinensis]